MTEIAKERGFRIIKKAIYKESKSAKLPDKRPKLNEMIELLKMAQSMQF